MNPEVCVGGELLDIGLSAAPKLDDAFSKINTPGARHRPPG